ncbi:MAG TPA: 50S ribosomal protein L35 [Bacteroidetes bacterium]|jgi:large subunit ribosomal protein L35|nr:MAG: 50S ribosomal protein L35 [Sphingobacteriales bacterium BACL12 MAG-120802-bin5]KRP13342.1 MAG: 50S ribosomal protein L35 [Sphingobacteriales bacterium BACL12 MAG-120813-bin55]HCK20868.1 50S ribosomal protein L35 [Bacteroidota bacterium]
MPKMKPNRSSKKRFSLTGSGKLKRSKAYHSHILTKKSNKRKKRLQGTTTVHQADQPRIKRSLGLA